MSKTVRNPGAPTAAARADEELLLALLNTTPIVEATRHDDLEGDAQARAWIAEHVPDAPEHTDLPLLRTTRSALQQVVRGDADPQVLNDALAGVRLRPEAGRDGISWVHDIPADAAIAARAVLAWGRVQADLPGRLRPCANEECSLFFIDRSRPNSGRWCSMAVCGNRMKARRHYARTTAER